MGGGLCFVFVLGLFVFFFVFFFCFLFFFGGLGFLLLLLCGVFQYYLGFRRAERLLFCFVFVLFFV